MIQVRFVSTLAAAVLLGGLMSVLRAQTAPSSTQPTTIAIPATLEAFEAADLYAKDSGFLAEVKADIGDHVKQGQVLAVIDDPELAKQAESAVAALTARRELAKAAEAAVTQSQKNLEVVRSQRAGYQAELDLAQVTLKRQEELFAQKATTSQGLDEYRAKAAVAKAQADVAAAKVAAAEADVTAAEANLGVAKSQVAVADAEAQRLKALLQYTSIIAPFDGVITRRLVSRGDLVQSGAANRTTPLFTCQRIDTIRVFCDVPESAAVGVAAGNAVSVKVFGLDNQVVTGTVTRIATALNPTSRTMRAEIDLSNPNEKLRPGMYAQVTVTLSPRARADAKP